MKMTPFENDAGGDFRPTGGVAESRAGERWPVAMMFPRSSVGLHQKKKPAKGWRASKSAIGENLVRKPSTGRKLVTKYLN